MTVFVWVILVLISICSWQTSHSLSVYDRGQVLGVWWTNKRPLNVNTYGDSIPTNAKDSLLIARGFVETFKQIRQNFVSENGKTVNYRSLKDSKQFKDYQLAARELVHLDMLQLGAEQRRSLLINVYNALTVDSITVDAVKMFPPGSLGRLRFYAKTAYNIDNISFSLNDIENGLLRANRGSPAPYAKLPFQADGSSSDKRLQYIVPCDARIHCALNCGAMSCPAINVYNSDFPTNLNTELKTATEVFIEDNLLIDCDNKCLKLSMIFNWYKIDFCTEAMAFSDGIDEDMKEAFSFISSTKIETTGEDDLVINNRNLLVWILRHASTGKRLEILDFLKSTKPRADTMIQFSKYDWTLNEA